MKVLKKMLLINWHYIDKEVIEFDNINFLTGKNGAGKSTIIDALQLLIIGDKRGTFFNKAANDKAGRSLEGYLRGEIGDDGDIGYKYKRNDRFSSYIVCEFYDRVTRKSFCLGIVFDVYKDSDTESKFFYINGKIPENEFVGEGDIPFSCKDLKSFLSREYGSKNFEIYTSQKQYQEASRGKLGGLNQKFSSLFKKAVTFTPINDIEDFIEEYVCDVQNKIDITSMQENIRQYNNLSKQVEKMKERQEELEEIERIYNKYTDNYLKQREEEYIMLRADKQVIMENIETLNNNAEESKKEKQNLEKENEKLETEKSNLENEIDELKEIRAKSEIAVKTKRLEEQIEKLKNEIDDIEKIEEKDIRFFRNNTLKWEASISKLDEIKNKIVADEIKELGKVKDLIKYLEGINNNNFCETDIEAISEIREKIKKIIDMGFSVYTNVSIEKSKDVKEKENLENDVRKLSKGINTYKDELINFKFDLEKRLSQKYGKEIKTEILADLLEINDIKWQNAIEGYLNNQKNYIIIEPEYFEEASKIYRKMAREDEKLHSFGIVDVEKIEMENKQILQNSLAEEIVTQNKWARVYADYLLGRVIKCETVEELRKNKIAITEDCMLYQGYVIRRINPALYKYPSIGKKALQIQKQMKEEELNKLNKKIIQEENIIEIMDKVKKMQNFSESDIENFEDDIEKAKKKDEYVKQKEELKAELDSIDMLWLNNLDEEINGKEKIKKDKEEKLLSNVEKIAGLKKDIEIIENEKINEKQEELNNKDKEINDSFDKEWQENIGEEKYKSKILEKSAEKLQVIYKKLKERTEETGNEIKENLVNKKSDYNTKYQMAYNILDGSNEEFSQALKELKEVTLPEYVEKIEDSRVKAYEQFKIEFLDKLKLNIEEVKVQIKELNDALSAHTFGADSYKFKVTPKQEYKRFYDMINSDMLLGDWLIGREQFNQKYSQEIQELFDKVTSNDINSNLISDEEYERNIKIFTDYRTYLNFDLIVKDKDGNEQRLSKTLTKKSGGETQTPFYIAILASFAQMYRIKKRENTVRLIVFDEAFSKMDSERIEESIKLLKGIEFQAIFAAPPDKLQDIQPLVDSTLLVMNPEPYKIVVRKYTKKEEW